MRKLTFTGIIAGTAIVGLAAGITGTIALAPAPAPAPVVTHDAHCDGMAERILANAGMMLTAWESGTPYAPEFRADNIDVYAAQLAACNSDTPEIQ